MIFVFRTSVRTQAEVTMLRPHIDRMMPQAKWNFDLEDVDNILRIDSNTDIVLVTLHLLNRHHFACEELH